MSGPCADRLALVGESAAVRTTPIDDGPGVRADLKSAQRSIDVWGERLECRPRCR